MRTIRKFLLSKPLWIEFPKPHHSNQRPHFPRWDLVFVWNEINDSYTPTPEPDYLEAALIAILQVLIHSLLLILSDPFRSSHWRYSRVSHRSRRNWITGRNAGRKASSLPERRQIASDLSTLRSLASRTTIGRVYSHASRFAQSDSVYEHRGIVGDNPRHQIRRGQRNDQNPCVANDHRTRIASRHARFEVTCVATIGTSGSWKCWEGRFDQAMRRSAFDCFLKTRFSLFLKTQCPKFSDAIWAAWFFRCVVGYWMEHSWKRWGSRTFWGSTICKLLRAIRSNDRWSSCFSWGLWIADL